MNSKGEIFGVETIFKFMVTVNRRNYVVKSLGKTLLNILSLKSVMTEEKLYSKCVKRQIGSSY